MYVEQGITKEVSHVNYALSETQMKKIFYQLTLAVVLFAASFYMPLPNLKHNKLTLERSATHEISYVQVLNNGEHKDVGRCTGTAIGPHALLTAQHCDEEGIRIIHMDYSVREYHILVGMIDGRDHAIYILDGPAFKNYVNVQQRVTKMGESVTSYGTGGDDFPPHTYQGTVIACSNGGDQSDVDALDDTACLSIEAIPGDSGSAVYGNDGAIVALLTYANQDPPSSTGFSLAFDDEVFKQLRDLKETQNNGINDYITKPYSGGDAGTGSPYGHP